MAKIAKNKRFIGKMSDKPGSSLMGNTGPRRTTLPRDKLTTGVGSPGLPAQGRTHTTGSCNQYILRI